MRIGALGVALGIILSASAYADLVYPSSSGGQIIYSPLIRPGAAPGSQVILDQDGPRQVVLPGLGGGVVVRSKAGTEAATRPGLGGSLVVRRGDETVSAILRTPLSPGVRHWRPAELLVDPALAGPPAVAVAAAPEMPSVSVLVDE